MNYHDEFKSRQAFADRLSILVKRHGGPTAFARRVGTSLSALRKWLRADAEPRRDSLIAITQATGVSLQWLAVGDEPDSGAGNATTNYVAMPSREVRLEENGRTKTLSSPRIVDYMTFKRDWVREYLGAEPEQILLVMAAGDDLPQGIAHGDLLLVNRGDQQVRENGIFAIDIEGEIALRRIQRKLDGTLIVTAGHPAYEREEVSPCGIESIGVVGRVIRVCRPVI
ncbi:MAG: hypothetical protein CMM50_02575 [Rhodospirillaceae bacterium]|nr:hypothetical protein [Rhodospirillaceae bacterium]|tara:strand:+ start:2217 stop:2894 length:678 start_codon:yes stop_codon:yes gene_type:complete